MDFWEIHLKRGVHTVQIVTCGIDTAKNIFHIVGQTNDGEMVNKRLKRKQLLPFFAQSAGCLIGMEACGGSHYWARELTKLGHTVRLISPQYVKPFVKGNKNDCNDAEAIWEAMQRPTMRTVSIKTQAQQDVLMLHRIRDFQVKKRTGLVNQIRGLLAEYGIVIARGIETLRRDICRVISEEDRRLSPLAREHFYALYEELLHLDDVIARSERALKAIFKQCRDCQRLSTLPGVGYLTATALVATIGDSSAFKNGRELAAYFGLVPKQHSSGGKPVLLGISKRGNTYVRTLLIHGARTVQRHANGKVDPHSQWLNQVEARRGKNKACVAQANKTARRVWALLNQGTDYQVAA